MQDAVARLKEAASVSGDLEQADIAEAIAAAVEAAADLAEERWIQAAQAAMAVQMTETEKEVREAFDDMVRQDRLNRLALAEADMALWQSRTSQPKAAVLRIVVPAAVPSPKAVAK
jgi:hypothetical protein